MREIVRSRPPEDRGAVLVIIAAFMTVAVILVAVVVDLGGLRQEKKEVTLSTDAAALAAAALADMDDPSLLTPMVGADCAEVDIDGDAENPEGFIDVQEVVDDYLGRNGDSQHVDCEVVRTGVQTGYVVVTADEDVDYQVASAFGETGGSVSGVTVAAVESDPGGGLRPIGICGAMTSLAYPSYAEVSLTDLFTIGSGGYSLDVNGYVTPSPFTARFAIEHVKGGSCGGVGVSGSGNFGQVNFGPANNWDCDDPGHFCTDLREGYYGSVLNPSWGNTGSPWNNASTSDSLDDLRDDVGMFWAPVFTSASKTGANTELTIAYFAQFELVNFCTSGGCKYAEPGAPASTKSTYFDVRVSRMIPYTPAGPPPTDDATRQPPRICAVTDETADILANCL